MTGASSSPPASGRGDDTTANTVVAMDHAEFALWKRWAALVALTNGAWSPLTSVTR